MTSEEYIIRLLQTIESLNSMVVGLQDELEPLRRKEAEDDLERKRLMAMIEAKDQDIRDLTGHGADAYRDVMPQEGPRGQVTPADEPQPRTVRHQDQPQ